VESTRSPSRIVIAPWPGSPSVHAGPAAPIANAAVAYASAVASSGPTTVTESAPAAGRPVCGSTMCGPRS